MGMTFVWAIELGKYGITVNAMSPAGATRMTASLFERTGTEPPPEANPALNAPIVTFLASEGAAHVNGQIVGRTDFAYTIYQTPKQVGFMWQDGGWEVDGVVENFDSILGQHLQHVGMTMPSGMEHKKSGSRVARPQRARRADRRPDPRRGARTPRSSTSGRTPPDADLTGDVLFGGWGPHSFEYARRVPWVQLSGTGVDKVPQELLRGPHRHVRPGRERDPDLGVRARGDAGVREAVPGRLAVTSRPSTGTSTSSAGCPGGRSGIVGLGGIGIAVAERALPFGMRVMAMRRTEAPSPVAGVELHTSLDAAARGVGPPRARGAAHTRAPSTCSTRRRSPR